MKKNQNGVFYRLRNDMGLWLYGGIAALAVVVFMLAWFGVQMHRLGTWNDATQELTKSFAAAYQQGATLTKDGETVEADESALDQFFALVTAEKTVPIAKKAPQQSEQTIALHLPDTTVFFTPVDGAYKIGMQWTQDGETYAYTLKAHVEFHNLDSYVSAAANRAG